LRGPPNIKIISFFSKKKEKIFFPPEVPTDGPHHFFFFWGANIPGRAQFPPPLFFFWRPPCFFPRGPLLFLRETFCGESFLPPRNHIFDPGVKFRVLGRAPKFGTLRSFRSSQLRGPVSNCKQILGGETVGGQKSRWGKGFGIIPLRGHAVRLIISSH